MSSGAGLTTRAAWLVGVLLVGGLYLAHAAIFAGYIADDAGISLAYARNLVAGYGPVLYPGGEAVEGYSNPLWTALLALGAALRLDGRDGIPLMKALCLSIGGGTLLLTVWGSRILYPGDRIRWLAPALLASLTPFVFWTASGMENALYAFLMLLAVTLQVRELADPAARPWSAGALAALALTRPEGVAFAVPFLLHRIVCGERRRRLLVWVGVVAGIYGVFLTTRVIVFAEWVPNTYYAKVDIYERRLSSLLTYLTDRRDPGTRYVLQFVAANWLVCLGAGAALATLRHWRTNLLIAAVLAGTACYAVYVRGDFWPADRFFTATLPLLAVAVQHGVNRLSRREPLVAACAGAIIVGVVLNRNLAASADLYVANAGDALISLHGRLQHARRLQAVSSSLGIRDPLVLDPDIGGPAVAGLRVLDLGGLADVHIARFHYYGPFFRSYVFEERRPHFIRTHATWTRSSRLTAFPEFERQYAAIRSTRDTLGLHGEFVRRDVLDRRAHPDDPVAGSASFRQAIEDGRARRRREDERARTMSNPPGSRRSPRP